MTPKAIWTALLAATGVIAAAVPAHCDTPVLHQITYTVSTQVPAAADIYYRDADPPSWADYSHNPYLFSPKVSVDLAPGSPWVLHATLADPDRWAMVTATSGRSPAQPVFRCELSVDGVVVATGEGPKGALCSIRHW